MSAAASPGFSGLFSGRPLRLIAGGVLIVNGMFPALWILFTSLKTEAELTAKPITWVPHAPTLSNYMQAFSDQPLHLFLFNSFMVALLSTCLTLLVSVLAAYALARLNLRYRGLILSLIIAVSTFPLVTLLVPLFEIMRTLNLLNTWIALVLPYTVLSLPVCTLMLVSFFEGIPRDLENAAMIDGCTRMGALFKVVVPLCAPGVFTAGILAFVNAWDEFLLALSFNSNPALRTLPVGIQLYQGEFAFPWPVISAALVVGIVPVAVLIVIFQERVVSGLTAGGIKG
ncbi:MULTISPECIES: carbohydrate ABC transporter permease [unclassified Shinella]|uniref:carbohydrate ABC transporter permease n=1 Tax=unclassified Shinella TaxID=2643062 RepID=UPI00225CEFA0|nr:MULTISPECIES: carbohydrate ABC transporter permease [unclassified Shinella]MCO5141185.1 carbohydrate ABC transporter permease [Shinella sp.]MDC7260043.1 carbohydrate ABC transporter permease [Shinella sp. YE25]CAI0341503.1 Carbohydrate ABC transporter membrane protein 2 (CUT1 family) [Rhizobiaceae bacterium]CAK7261131.1 multiple sugar transport system permease protein [Shinella sp. WSC3-e]